MSNYQSNEIKLINTSLIDPHPDNPRTVSYTHLTLPTNSLV